ncbi:MAG: META domain-containing protein [Psychromonas sp.]|nr:META domain-containing protein [Psychromonas sp.]
MKIIKFIPVLLALLPLACTSTPSKKVTQQKALIKIEKLWKLIAIDGRTVNANIKSTLHIDSKLKASGNFGCNLFWGNAELKDHKFIIRKVASTRKRCKTKTNKVERKVSGVFSHWSQVKLSETKLILSDKTHTLTYEIDID